MLIFLKKITISKATSHKAAMPNQPRTILHFKRLRKLNDSKKNVHMRSAPAQSGRSS